MKTIIVAAVILIIGWYGNSLYKKHGLPFMHKSGTIFESDNQLKCITKDGRVLYGSVPQGTICERLEPVKGSLTIVPSEFFTSFIKDKKRILRPSKFNAMVEHIVLK